MDYRSTLKTFITHKQLDRFKERFPLEAKSYRGKCAEVVWLEKAIEDNVKLLNNMKTVDDIEKE